MFINISLISFLDLDLFVDFLFSLIDYEFRRQKVVIFGKSFPFRFNQMVPLVNLIVVFQFKVNIVFFKNFKNGLHLTKMVPANIQVRFLSLFSEISFF